MNTRPANQQLIQAVRTICGRRSGLSAPAVALLGFSMVSVAIAGPTGGVVVDGQATISTPAAGTTVIDQTSQHVQVNWNTFDVGANESVRFQQPNSSSVALNRILDQNPSQIFGRIDANGQVILVNPNGMLFGASAQLNVGSLVASSLDVIGFDAASGRYTFGTSRTDVGAIVNDGAITAANGGSVTLLGGRVTNTGSIIADFGTVNLAAGRAATLDLAGDGLLRLEVDGELLTNNSGAGAAVENGGVIQANGGQVLLTAQAVDDVFTNLVNNTGVVRANRIDNSGGTIRLIGAGGTVRSSGVLDASAGDGVSSGGTVEMLGEQVGLFGAALVDVSGATDGGTALIGGDYQGKNPDVLNAARTYVSSDASIRADAGLYGNGGRVIVWADEITRFGGSISARGGALSGNGGFAEVSGKETLLFRGSANLSAANGFAGELLLDPRNITVATGGVGDLAGGTGDDGVANAYAFAEDAANDITIAPSTITNILDTGTTVTLQAHNDIRVTNAIDGSASTTAGGGLIFQAGDDIFINANVRTNNGAIQFTAGDDAATPTGGNGDDAPRGEMRLASGVTLSAGAAAVTLNSDGDMQLLGTVSGNAITAVSGGTLTVATLNAGTGAVNLTATGALLDDGANTTRITGGALTMSATAIGESSTSDEIDTAVSSLNATASNGGVYISETNGLSLANVSAAGAGSDVRLISAAGNIVVGTVQAADAVTLTATTGAITDDGDDATRIASGTLTLTGTAIGASGASGQIDTDITSLTATASAGGVYITEANGLTLTDVRASALGSDVNVTSTTGDIVVGTVIANDTMTLSATVGAITDDNTNTTRIEAGSLTLTARTAIGASGGTGQIDTDVTSLTAIAEAGSVYIAEVDDVTLTNVRAAGAGNDVVVTSAAGNIEVGTVSADNAVVLEADGAITDDGDVTRISAVTLTLNADGAIGSAVTGGQIDTDVNSLTATAGAGGVYIGEANGLTLTSVSATTAGSDVHVSTATGDIVVNTVRAADQVILTATSGAISDDGDNATRIAAGTLTLDARTAIGAADANGEIDTDVNTLSAFADAGGIYVGESSGITLSTVDAAGAGSDVHVTSAGTITVGSVSAADEVTLDSTGGNISDDSNNATRIAAQTATLTGGAIGASGVSGQIDTDLTSLTATARTGSVYIGELDGITLTNVSAAGAGNDVNVTSTTGDIVANTVTAPDDVTLTATAGDIVVASISAADAVTLSATAGSILDDGDNTTRINVAGNLTLSAGTAIGAAGGTGEIDTAATSLTASATTGGVYIGDVDGLTLTDVRAGTDVSVFSATGDMVATSVTASNNVALTAAAGNIVVTSITGANAVTLSATTGSIVDDGVNTTRIAGGNLELNAGAAIGATGGTGQIDTTATSLRASAGAGGVYIGEANGLTLTNVSAAGAGNDVIVTSATGDIVANTVTAPDAVTLSALAGDIVAGNISAAGAVTLGAAGITDDDNDATVISGGTVSLSATTNIGTVVDFDAVNDADVGSSLDVQTGGALTATVTNDNGQINLNISGAPAWSAGAITLGSGSNRSGAIVLQSPGDLNVGGLAAGAINIGSANTTQLGLRSGGVLTLPASGGFTDQPVDQLLVRGAIDVIDSDATPREFMLEATSLDFRSGAAGGATVLNTTVGRLSARIGNDQNLTVNETNGLTLGTLDVGNGNITLTAGGAVTDDGDDLTRIVANSATLSGTLLGAAGNSLDTQVNTLTASATSGGVYVSEADALALTVSATGGAADVRTTNGALTVAAASGNGVTLVSGGAGSDITLNGSVNAGAGDVTLTAGTAASRGAIVAGSGAHITGNALIATASTIGSGAARLNTTVASVNATSTNGGIFITEADAVSLAANASGGAVDVETTNGALTVTQATGNGVTLTAGGAGNGITLNGAVNAGAGNVILTAGTAASGAIIAGAGNQITGESLVMSASTIGTGAARLNTSVNTVNATSTNGGMFITEADALNLTASATNGMTDVRTTNGALTVTQATGNGVTLVSGGAGNGITLNGAVNAGAGDVTLTAGTAANRGAIVAGAGNHITAGSLVATGSIIGSSAARLNTTVGSLNATSTNGGIFITETDALNLTASATGGAVDVQTSNGSLTTAAVSGNGVTLTAGGAGNGITLNGTVNAGAGDVTLTAGSLASRGAIVGGAGNKITAASLTATGSAIGTSTTRLNTAVASLNARSTNGGIFVTEANAVSLAANASGGAVDIQTANGALTVTQATGDGVTLTAGGAGNGITLNGAVNGGAGNVTLTAGTAASRGAIVAGAGNQITGSSLTVSGSTIGAGDARLNTSVNTLNATSTNGGLFIAETNALNLTASATGGAVDVQTGNGSLTVAAVSGDGVTLVAGGAASEITLNGAVNARAGDVTLTAGTAASRGAIVGTAGHSISARSLTATAAAIGASNARVNTNIDTLNAVASTGDVYISEQNGLTLASVSAARDIGVASAAGDIVVNNVAAANGVALTATSGAIADDGDDSTLVVANALTLSARSVGAASTLSGTTLDGSARLDTDVETLNATTTGGGIFIDEANGLQSVNLQASGGEAGDIELLTRGGDLILNNVSASDSLLLAAGRNIFAAPGAGPVTARRAELRAGTTDPAGGLIGRVSDPIEFQLSAGNSLRLFVPQTIDPDDPNRAPAVSPTPGVTSTINLFASQAMLAALAGFNQFQGLGETQFTSPAQTLVRSLQSQTGTVETGLEIDWVSFDPDVSLFGTLEPSVCLPAGQRDEESSTPDC